jgi:hypothetical protein
MKLATQAFAQSEEGEPVHISPNTKSFILDFFSFKRMMSVTEKRGTGAR